MMRDKLRLINKNQWGFTLLEVMLIVAVSGIISTGITMTFFQVVTGSARASNRVIVISQVQSAGYWVSHDTQLAQGVDVDDGSTGFPLVLSWTGWDDKSHQVTYTLEEAAGGLNQLKQSHKIDNGDPVVNIVAKCIELADVSPKSYTGGVLTFKVKVTVGVGSQQQSETREYKIVPRPGS